jgi:thioredoxin reductase (NADPH)
VEPVILVVVDDEPSLQAMAAELGRYQRDYRVEPVRGGGEALDRIGALRADGGSLAMVLADVRLHPDGGVDVLTQVRAAVPTAKRVLLMDWGLRPEQLPVVLRATALGIVDTFLTKPTGARDEEFHTAITEELGDWAWTRTPAVEAVRIVGDAGDARVGGTRALLERLGVPTGVHAPDSPAGRAISARAAPGAPLPLVEVMGQTVLADPTDREMAVAFGVSVDVGTTVFDLAVVGSGPAGLGAAVYGASEGLSTLILESEAFGGQAGTSSMIRNYLGFPRGISGRQLGRRAVLQAVRFGAALDLARAVTGLRPGDPHRLVLSDGAVARARAVVLACGVTYRRLEVPALEALVGAGVFYGAAGSHARAMEGADVVVVGAGNSGGQAAVHLARHAHRVLLVARGATLADTMSSYLVREIEAEGRIEVRAETDVVDGGGDGNLEWLELAHRRTHQQDRVAASALFVLIGTETRTAWLTDVVQRDDHGFVRTGADVDAAGWPVDRPPLPLETSVPGVFAAGDVRAGSVKRVAVAAGEGATCVPMVHRFLAGLASEAGG